MSDEELAKIDSAAHAGLQNQLHHHDLSGLFPDKSININLSALAFDYQFKELDMNEKVLVTVFFHYFL